MVGMINGNISEPRNRKIFIKGNSKNLSTLPFMRDSGDGNGFECKDTGFDGGFNARSCECDCVLDGGSSLSLLSALEVEVFSFDSTSAVSLLSALEGFSFDSNSAVSVSLLSALEAEVFSFDSTSAVSLLFDGGLDCVSALGMVGESFSFDSTGFWQRC